jgi:hypothetical protein
MKMFYDDFEVGDTIGYDENWDGRLTGRMIEHVLTEISLKDIKTWETKQNPHNMRIIKKGTNKTTQQIIDEDFEGGLTMGQIQCKDCNDNLTDCTCIEDTIDMKQETLNEVALEFAKDHHKMYETNNFGAMHFGFCWGAKWQQERSYGDEDIIDAWEIGAREGLPLTRKKKEDLFKQLKK